MLSDRENKILKIIVEDYIKDAREVSSKKISEDLNCSSATVRNEMAILEEKGFIQKTHTSSGRIPSDLGYNYYVSNLMDLKSITGEDMLKLQMIFSNKNLELSDAINKSLEIITELTSYATVKLGKAADDNRLKEVKAITLNNKNIVVIVVTDKGHVEHKNVNLPNVTSEEVEKTITLINKLIIGTPLCEVNKKLEYEVKPIISRYVQEYELMYNAFYKVFESIMEKNINVRGEKEFLKLPEFKDESDKVYEILDALDEDNLINKFTKANNKIEVFIGEENEIDDDVTVVKTNYKTDSEEGVLAVVGPKRMDYKRVVNILNYLKDKIEEIGDDDD